LSDCRAGGRPKISRTVGVGESASKVMPVPASAQRLDALAPHSELQELPLLPEQEANPEGHSKPLISLGLIPRLG
jgi:hypothetical protein